MNKLLITLCGICLYLVNFTVYADTRGLEKPLVKAISVAPALCNISVRAHSQGLVLGFVIAGTDHRTVIIRALGPAISAAPFRVENTISNPKLTLFNQNRTIIAQNDDWDGTLASKQAMDQAGAFAIAVGGRDSAVIITLPPGTYTATVDPSGASAHGIAHLELYDLSQSKKESLGSQLVNTSIRLAGVGTGNSSAIVGFVLQNIGERNMLVRAVGPSLASFGVDQLMQNPSVTIYDGQARVVIANEDWNQTMSSLFAQTGAFALLTGSKDSAVTFRASVNGATSYTAVVPGVGNALVEVYQVP